MAFQSLVNRLTAQLAASGNVKDPAAEARALLIKRGHMHPDGSLTQEGRKREAMGPAGRAKDRAAKGTDHNPNDFTYDSTTNRVKLKRS